MNERIKELAEQAYALCGKHTNNYDGPAFAEKFAGLIVRECAGVCHTHGWEMLAHGMSGHSIADDCGTLIKQHFEVEA